eukprot:UN12112
MKFAKCLEIIEFSKFLEIIGNVEYQRACLQPRGLKLFQNRLRKHLDAKPRRNQNEWFAKGKRKLLILRSII